MLTHFLGDVKGFLSSLAWVLSLFGLLTTTCLSLLHMCEPYSVAALVFEVVVPCFLSEVDAIAATDCLEGVVGCLLGCYLCRGLLLGC